MATPLLMIFDCDGVLVDSEIIAADVEAKMLKDYGLEMSAEDFAIRFAGLTWPTILSRLSEESGIRFPDDLTEKAEAEIDRRLSEEVEEIAGAREAIEATVHHAFTRLDISRVEAACLPENIASRGLLEKTGFKYEGVAQSYLQIDGRWRTHVLYAQLRGDRRGKTAAG